MASPSVEKGPSAKACRRQAYAMAARGAASLDVLKKVRLRSPILRGPRIWALLRRSAIGALPNYTIAGLLVILTSLGCSSSPRLYLQHGDKVTQLDLDQILAESPLSPTENIKVTTLGQTAEVSHHIVQVRDREPPHIHKDHDVTVVVLKGRGYLIFGKERVDLAAGDTLFIPRGVVHYFINTSAEPAAALGVFSPPFDGQDTVPVEESP